jgi:GH15 family glucan-1,4-alpha-glucosidase
MANYLPIADYATIGDCHTAALVSRHGSIDWYCPGRFDAAALFCRLLDDTRGGYWRVVPLSSTGVERRYRRDTNVLETIFTADGGRMRLSDFMPAPSRAGRIVRLVEVLDGEIDVGMDYRPTPNYARARLSVQAGPARGIVVSDGERSWTLAGTALDLAVQPDGRWSVSWHLSRGDRRWLVLADGTLPDAPEPPELEQMLSATVDHWQRWASHCTYRGRHRDAVLRSALVLKLLSYEPSGALVAAPTTSLPETAGGVRNWDYRFTWLRDSSLILYALMTIGYEVEADEFFHWAAGAIRANTPRILYGIDGEQPLGETPLDYLDGYLGSRPVRIGNAAADQVQLDIFGEVVRSAYLHQHAVHPYREPNPYGGTREHWDLLSGLIERAAEGWQHPDSGIWEVRGGPQDFLYSKLMCWVALDRGLRLAHELKLSAPVDRWSSARDQLRQAILERGYDRQVGAFTQALGSSALDATALMVPIVGFLPPTDPRCLSTIARIESGLTTHGLVDRYRAPDGLPGAEGSFVLCSFWLADALALAGKIDEAEARFDRLLGYANDLGLLSEEVDASSGLLLGNFPQGFSHLALITAAVNLAKARRHGPEHRAETEADRAPRARAAAAGADAPA